MLQSIREASKGWIAWVIVVAISIPFALWGIERFNTQETGEQVIATLGEHEITYYDFYNALSNQRQILQQRYPNRYEQINQDRLKREVWQQQMGRGVIFASAINFGMEVGENQLKKEIANNDQFLTDGQFDGNKYRDFLSLNNLSAPAYEMEMLEQMRYNQYVRGFFNSNITTKKDLETLFQINNHERKFAYLILPWQQSSGSVTISDEEYKTDYDNNIQLFGVAEKVKVEYIKVSRSELAKNIEFTEEDIKQYFEQNINNFTPPETRKARHILFDIADKELAEKVRIDILAGADFAKLAKKHSLDTFSAEKGGDLGEVSRGQMVAAFEDSLFSLVLGDVSELVETDFGYHIIEVTEINGGVVPLYEDVKETVKVDYQNIKALDKLYEIQEKMVDLAFVQSDSLQPIQDELNLPVQQTEWFERSTGVSSDTITQFESFRQAAFDSQVLNENVNSSVFELPDNQIAVLRLMERKVAYTKSLDEVKDQLKELITVKKASKLLLEQVQADIDKVKSQALTWDGFAQKYELSGFSQKKLRWSSLSELGEDSIPVDVEVYNTVYNLNRVKKAKFPNGLYTAQKMNNGSILTIHLTDSRDVEISEEDIGKESEVHKIMNNFQVDTARLGILEVLQTRYPIPSVDIDSL